MIVTKGQYKGKDAEIVERRIASALVKIDGEVIWLPLSEFE